MNKPIKVVLLDDEMPCTETLAMQISDLEIDVDILAKFNDPLKALDFIRSNQFDILFLDVEMPEMNGFTLLSMLPEIDFDVVFTTAYNQYAIKAFKYSALNYLLKPIDDDELCSCFKMWTNKQTKVLDPDQLKNLLALLDERDQQYDRIALPISDGYEFIDIRQIIRCQADNYYTHIHLLTGKEVMVCRSLKEVEHLLKSSGFLRIHQSHLINPVHILKYSRQDGGSITMADETRVSVSKSYRPQLLGHFDKIQKL
jgi:two-component system LytT family response regulator